MPAGTATGTTDFGGMDRARLLTEARAAFDRRAWESAWLAFSSADAKESLLGPDLDRLATAAMLSGHDDESDRAWLRSYRARIAAGDVAHALRCLFWLTFRLLNSGRIEQANGWIARAEKLLDDTDPDCVERGYVAYLTGFQAVFAGDVPHAMDGFEAAAADGVRHHDIDLQVLGQTGLSRMLIRLDRQAEGLHLLDEVMVALAESPVAPIVVGDVYCTAIEACSETFDVRRANEWTHALTRWCEEQPDLVPYRGQCLVHRSELLQLVGDWPAALDQANRARDQLSRPTLQLALGAACYQQGELHRLRGEFAKAEDAYGFASRHGREPQPGLALLRLAQGQMDSAASMSRRLVGESESWPDRARTLPPHVEIMLAVGDTASAREAADELTSHAANQSGPRLQAIAAQMLGHVLVADGANGSALRPLRQAHGLWNSLGAPYEAARTRVLIAQACVGLGDADSAALEIDAARRVFDELGAVVDLRGLPVARGDTRMLTQREVEVLRLLTSGRTNRAIGEELVLSERTVERHVSNIFRKLDVSTRSAATAYAFEHGIA
jgi:DNA-binding CsgD family transcriptional regulator